MTLQLPCPNPQKLDDVGCRPERIGDRRPVAERHGGDERPTLFGDDRLASRAPGAVEVREPLQRNHIRGDRPPDDHRCPGRLGSGTALGFAIGDGYEVVARPGGLAC